MWSGFHSARAGELPVNAKATAKSHGRKAGATETFFTAWSVSFSRAKDGIGIIVRWALVVGIPINPFGDRTPPSHNVNRFGLMLSQSAQEGWPGSITNPGPNTLGSC